MTLEELLSKKIVSLPPAPSSTMFVDRDLDRIWEALRQGWSDAEAVTRACMSNLLIYCDNKEQAASVRCDLPHILQVHPARVLLMWEEETEDSANDITTTVSAHFSCVNDGLQVLGEEVCVACSSNADQRLPSVARSLLIGDLPTALWWASSRPPISAGKLFLELIEIADQLIFDSLGWVNPPKAILAMSQWITADSREHVIYNLAWRRLKAWRKILRETLDPAVLAAPLTETTQLELEHGPHALPMTWLLVGWLADRLNWKALDGKLLSKSSVIWRFQTPGGVVQVQINRRSLGDPIIYRFDWHWRGGRACFQAQGELKLEASFDHMDGPSRTVVVRKQDRTTLVAEQLAHRFRDSQYEGAIGVANTMAAVLLR